jgi:hypothetical protein
VSSKDSEIAAELRKVQILLAGLLLKEEPRPNVEKLEGFIGVRKGTLSELFPQRKPKTGNKATAPAREVNS